MSGEKQLLGIDNNTSSINSVYYSRTEGNVSLVNISNVYSDVLDVDLRGTTNNVFHILNTHASNALQYNVLSYANYSGAITHAEANDSIAGAGSDQVKYTSTYSRLIFQGRNNTSNPNTSDAGMAIEYVLSRI